MSEIDALTVMLCEAGQHCNCVRQRRLALHVEFMYNFQGSHLFFFFDEFPVAFDAHKNRVTKHAAWSHVRRSGPWQPAPHKCSCVPVGHECEELMSDLFAVGEFVLFVVCLCCAFAIPAIVWLLVLSLLHLLSTKFRDGYRWFPSSEEKFVDPG